MAEGVNVPWGGGRWERNSRLLRKSCGKILGERVSESRGAEGKREMETEGKKQGQTKEMWKCTYQNVKSPS